MTPESNLSDFLRSYSASEGVFYLGHAGILAILGGKKILFDPIVESQPYGDSWVFFPPQVSEARLYDVDAVVVSHIHQDHYDIDFLRRLAPHVKVVIVGQRPSFEADIHAKADRPITVVPPEQVFELFPDVFLFGVTHESNGIDSSMIAWNDRFCVYHGNDNYLQPASMAKFPQVNANIDVACIPYAYIHWYPFLMRYPADRLHEKQQESDRLVNMYMDDCLSTMRILQPTVVIPFGANLLIDDGNMRSDINMAVKTPIEFKDYAEQRLPEMAGVVQPMLAGDYCGKPEGVLTVTIAKQYTAQSYRDEADDFLRARPQKSVRTDSRSVEISTFLAILTERMQSVEERIDNVLQFELGHGGETLRFELDLLTHQPQQVEVFTSGRPVHHFVLDAFSSSEFLGGKRFEEIIGMRRFTLWREPNVYLPNVLRIINTVV